MTRRHRRRGRGRRELKATLAGKPRSTLPLTTFVAGKPLVGFVEVGLRSHADGCDARRPVGFIEGWWVDPKHRKKNIGRRLIEAAMEWAKQQGCREIASDTWLDNEARSPRTGRSSSRSRTDW